ncbi:2'-5' RNA ligase family protein [Mycobacterium sp.]|uniref:2'-5' RNA ligase family protein n=1 Tax=Mycobacterium sp. TaxID=1785 RepID=UPI003A889BFE
MAHSLELLFDDRTEDAVRRIWAELGRAGLSGRAAVGRPHVTLVASEHIDSGIDEVLTRFARRLPLPCVVGAPVLFGHTGAILARLVVPSSELLDFHTEVHRLCRGYLKPMPNSLPGQWTPHVTLARRVGMGRLAPAVRIAGHPGRIGGSFTGLRRWDGDNRAEYLLE